MPEARRLPALWSARSYLFVPAGEARKLEKALASAADALILDLEDAILPEQKPVARDLLHRVLGGLGPAGDRRPLLFVRANAVGSPWWADEIRTLALPAVRGFSLPKVERLADLEAAAAMLVAAERQLGLDGGHFELLPMVETAAGVDGVQAIATGPRVSRLIFGALDLALDLGANWTPGPHQFLYHRSRLALASRAAGILPPVDSVWPRIDDLEGLAAEARQARDLGFQGKTVIHPKHIDVVNQAFSPTAAEVEWARRILAGAAAAARAGGGVVRVDGAMVDRPVIERARWILERA